MNFVPEMLTGMTGTTRQVQIIIQIYLIKYYYHKLILKLAILKKNYGRYLILVKKNQMQSLQ